MVSNEQIIQKITEFLNEKFSEPSLQDLFLTDVTVGGNQKIAVYIDADDNSFTIERCHVISRMIENYLETNALVGEKYTLDVSSPGVGKPLKFKRQYPKNVGRSLSVQLKDSDQKIEGPLHSITDDSIIIQYEEKVKIEGTKKKELKTIIHDIPFDNIKNAVVKISFSS